MNLGNTANRGCRPAGIGLIAQPEGIQRRPNNEKSAASALDSTPKFVNPGPQHVPGLPKPPQIAIAPPIARLPINSCLRDFSYPISIPLWNAASLRRLYC